MNLDYSYEEVDFNDFNLRMMLMRTLDRRIQNLKLTTGSLVVSSAGELGASLFLSLYLFVIPSPFFILYSLFIFSYKSLYLFIAPSPFFCLCNIYHHHCSYDHISLMIHWHLTSSFHCLIVHC